MESSTLSSNDAQSFGVIAAALVAIHGRPRPALSGHSMLADALDGVRYVRSQPWLWVTLATAGLANFAAFSPLDWAARSRRCCWRVSVLHAGA